MFCQKHMSAAAVSIIHGYQSWIGNELASSLFTLLLYVQEDTMFDLRTNFEDVPHMKDNRGWVSFMCVNFWHLRMLLYTLDISGNPYRPFICSAYSKKVFYKYWYQSNVGIQCCKIPCPAACLISTSIQMSKYLNHAAITAKHMTLSYPYIYTHTCPWMPY